MLREQSNSSEKYCFKISKNMLLIVFGQMGIHLLRYLDRIREKKEKIEKEKTSHSYKFDSNTLAFKETKSFFNKKYKESGFSKFVKKFLSQKNQYKLKDLQNNFQENILKKTHLEVNQRYQLLKKDEIFKLKQSKATTIQSQFRALSARRNFLRRNKEEIERRINHHLVKIQCQFRRYLIAKNIRIHLILQTVLEKRKLAISMINFNLKYFCENMKIKKYLLLKRILNTRLDKIKIIHKAFRSYYYRKKVNRILNKEKNFYSITYPFVCKKVRLVVYINFVGQVKELIYDFDYCTLRGTHVLYINPADFKSGNYRVKMIVDDHVTCDGRFPHIEFSDGQYYNIIHFSMKSSETESKDKTTHISEEKEVTESIVNESERNNSFNSDFFRKEINRNKISEFDKDLIQNLENKESKSYVEILKASVMNEINVNEENFDINI
jgi:hypothetical protein